MWLFLYFLYKSISIDGHRNIPVSGDLASFTDDVYEIQTLLYSRTNYYSASINYLYGTLLMACLATHKIHHNSRGLGGGPNYVD